MKQTMNLQEWALLFSLAIIWGGSYFFVDVALAQLPVISIVTLRVAGAALFLILLVYILGQRMPATWHAWRGMMCIGLLNNAAPFCLIVWGQTHISGGLASVLIAMTPVFSILVLRGLGVEKRIGGGKLTGLLLGITGVAVIIGPDVIEGLKADLTAQLAILLAAFSYACAGVYGKRLQGRGFSTLVITAGQVTASTVLLLPVVLWFDQPWLLSMPDTHVLLAIAGLALICTALAYVIYFRILSTAGPTNLLLVTFLAPISAIALGAIFLGQSFASEHYIGMVLVGAGLLAIDGRVFAIFTRKSEVHQEVTK
ncbi:DMT family transporter [Aliamphritea ceti]|uniref:DMT family transporter n=1 Tax=Aliamphritea ceti TaxID=1524258 RepID=UPI0021C29669|nr:DMT family transporter [Aliamphritea ceti]